MPYTVKFDKPPAGYTLSSARAGEKGTIQVSEFTSIADGYHFVQRVEGFPNEILEMVANQRPFQPSQVEHLLAIIRVDGECIVYINELEIKEEVRIARAVKPGEPLRRDDVVEITGVDVGVEIPPDCGFIYLFSRGWRRGLVYDFGPLTPNRQARTFDWSARLAHAHTTVLFYEKASLTEADWEAMMRARWFPFAGLSHSTIERSIGHVRAGWGLSELVSDIVEELRSKAGSFLESWQRHPSFGPHLQILERTVERFVAEDYMCATALMYPRIEGILRTHHSSTGAPRKPSQGNLAKTAVEARLDSGFSLLLPERFERYLSDVYFAGFNPAHAENAVSRNSVGHGVASVDDFNQISAAIGLLITQQLFYCLVRPEMNSVASQGSKQAE